VTAPSFPAAWERYRAHLVERGCRPRTISAYRFALYDFDAFLGDKPWRKATPRDLHRFLDRRPRSGKATGGRLSANTRLHNACIVVAFYRWARAAGLIGRDPMAAVALPKGGAPAVRALDLGDVRALLTWVGGDERLEVCVWLAFGCGLRVSEVARLRIEDVQLRGRPLLRVVCGKGGRARIVPLPVCVRDVLAAYLARRPAAGPLVCSQRDPGLGVQPQRVSRILAAAMHEAGIDDSAHALRHTFATVLLAADQGRNLYTVSKLLGHASTRTTERVYVAGYAGELDATVALLPDPRKGASHA
jgi:site-specific recombinase XerD